MDFSFVYHIGFAFVFICLFFALLAWVCERLSSVFYGPIFDGHLEWDSDQHDFMIPQKPDNSGKFWEKNKEVK